MSLTQCYDDVQIYESPKRSTPLVEKMFGVKECCVCLDVPPTVLVDPCGHLCLCDTCNEILSVLSNQKRLCPVCRTPIDKVAFVIS
jgi:hypothetical protein